VNDFYVLECSVEECVAEFYLNDIPVVRRGPALGQHYAGQSNHLLVDGYNELSILIEPGPTPGEAIVGEGGSRVRRPLPGARAVAHLCQYPPGATVGGPSRKEVMAIAWEAQGDEPMVLPRVATVRIDLGPLFGRWIWQDAPALSLNDQALAEVHETLASLHRSLEAGDPEPFIALSKTRLRELQRAYGTPPGAKERIIRKVMDDDSSQPWWGLQPLSGHHGGWRLCGRNGLVEILADDWRPALRENPDDSGGVGFYDLMLGRSEGTWEIVR